MTASLPYPDPDGTRTEGHAGSDTSRDRARAESRNGRAAARQADIVRYLTECGFFGATVAEVARGLRRNGWSLEATHHGKVSGSLSAMHKDGRIERIKVRRDRCEVYVMPDKVNGRALSPYRPNRSTITPADVEQARAEGHAAGWRVGFEEGKAEPNMLTSGALMAARNEGRNEAVAAILLHLDSMLEVTRHTGPVEPHTGTCWQRHPTCALRAAHRVTAGQKRS